MLRTNNVRNHYCALFKKYLTEDHKMLLTNLIRRRVQAQQVTVAPLLAGLGIAVIHVLESCAF